MIFVFLVFTIISIIVFYFVGKHYQIYGGMPTGILAICLASILVGITLFNVFMLAYIKGDTNFLMNQGTISKEEFNIDNYQEVKTTSDDNKAKVSYTYTIKNSKDKKTVSAKDTSVYSISISQSKNQINHLIIKHNTYFSPLTFMTTQKDEYAFSSK